jgi:hypothetical protein
MTNCSSGCPQPGSHATYGECLRAKGLGVELNGGANRRWDAELDLYRSARLQGIQPATTMTRDIRAALDASDTLGRPYDAAAGV